MIENASMYVQGKHHFEIEAGWEHNGERFECRWCVISCILNKSNYGRVAGIVAGYSGGAVFEIEPFYLEIDDNGEISKLIFEFGFDGVSDPDQEDDGDLNWHNEVKDDADEAVEAAGALLFRWNDEKTWDDDCALLLRSDMESHPDLKPEEDMLLLHTDNHPFPQWVCEASSLTSWPVFEQNSPPRFYRAERALIDSIKNQIK